MTFDPIGAAQTAAQATLTILLDPERAARLLQAPATDPHQLGLSETLDQLWAVTWKAQSAARRTPRFNGRLTMSPLPT